MAAPAPQGGTQAPQQLSPEWWMAFGPTGHPYYHNTKTNETTWSRPDLGTATTAKSMDQQAMASYQQSMGCGGGGGGGCGGGCGGCGGGGSCGGGGGYGAPGGYGGQQAPMQQQQPQGYQQGGGAPMNGCGGGYGGGGQQGYGGGAPQNYGGGAPQAAPAGGGAPPGEVSCTGNGNIPPPLFNYDQVNLPRPLVEPMLQAGFKAPTPIQAYAWPVLSGGRDLIAVAKTGSGKTLGFLLPCFGRMQTERMSGGPLMLVMAPTRELAVQIDADCKKYAAPGGITSALAYGGAPK
ncbi:unnamed protein product, partial [Polarella glacialis]